MPDRVRRNRRMQPVPASSAPGMQLHVAVECRQMILQRRSAAGWATASGDTSLLGAPYPSCLTVPPANRSSGQKLVAGAFGDVSLCADLACLHDRQNSGRIVRAASSGPSRQRKQPEPNVRLGQGRSLPKGSDLLAFLTRFPGATKVG
jgi:hypothetical protein